MKIVAFVIASMLVACSSAEEPDTAARERAVIEAVLEHREIGGPDIRPLIVIGEIWPFGDTIDDYVPAARRLAADDAHDSDQLVDAFVAANGDPARTDPVDAWGARSITQEEVDAYWTDPDGWDRLYVDHPGSRGYTLVSRPGFDDAGRALIYVGHQYGPLAGHGALHVLEQTDGVWHVVAGLGLWDS